MKIVEKSKQKSKKFIQLIKSARDYLSEPTKSRENENNSKTYLQIVQAGEIQNYSQKFKKSNESLTDTVSVCPICPQWCFFRKKERKKIHLTASSREQKGAKAT